MLKDFHVHNFQLELPRQRTLVRVRRLEGNGRIWGHLRWESLRSGARGRIPSDWGSHSHTLPTCCGYECPKDEHLSQPRDGYARPTFGNLTPPWPYWARAIEVGIMPGDATTLDRSSSGHA
jgi:hypothetical protein